MMDVIAFTGTQRDMTDIQKEVLLSSLIGFREGGAEWMHNGDCVEADEYAGRAWMAMGGKVHLHPPSNPSKRAYLPHERAEPPKPYMKRNQDIAEAGTVLVATPRQEAEQASGGTWFTVRSARERGLPIMIIFPSGRLALERWPQE